MSPDSVAFEPYPEADAVFQWLEVRYGIPQSVFAEHRLWHRPGAPTIWIAAAGVFPPPGAKVEAVGQMALRDPPPRSKPTSSFLQAFGAHATRNVYRLSPQEARAFINEERLLVQPLDDGHGYCVVFIGDQVLGCGRLSREAEADGRKRLICEIPRSWRESLADYTRAC